MLPRSSMATSRFTSTFFAASALEPAERLTVTMAGIISGAMPTAMASEKSSASMRGRDSGHVDDEDERGQDGRHPEQEAREARQAHFEGGLALLLGQARSDLPEGGAGSGPNHHAERRSLMDDRPHEGASRLVQRLAAGDGRRRLGHWHRLAGQHAFVALEFVDLQQAEVGRYQGADAERHHVAGHKVRDRDPARPSVPADLGFLSDLGAEGGHRHLRPVLVEEAQTRH